MTHLARRALRWVSTWCCSGVVWRKEEVEVEEEVGVWGKGEKEEKEEGEEGGGKEEWDGSEEVC